MSTPKIDLSEQVIFVVGGAGLLGAAFTESLAHAGAHVVVADLDAEKASAVSRKVASMDTAGSVSFVQMDVSSKDSIENAIHRIASEKQRIDGLVNAAYPRNRAYGRPVELVTYDDFCENVGLNLGGMFQACQAFGAFYTQQGHGNIVNIGSVYGVVAPRFEVYAGTDMTMPVEYAVIKSGVIHLTRYLASYYRGRNIRVNCLSPGGILDGQPDSFVSAYGEYCANKGMLDSQDICGALAFLLSEHARFITGQNVVVDDGFTL